MAENIKQKAFSSVIWTTIQKFAGSFIQFISGIVLARLLDPADYGCIGMLAIFMSIANVFIDAGFGSALIQKKRPTREDYSTIFFFNLGMSLLMYAVLFFSAPLIARYYHMDILASVLRVQGVVLIINAFATIQTNQLKKQFRFKKIATVTLLTSTVALGVTIYMAYSGFGVWALVTQHILAALIPAVIYWITNHWAPLLIFSKKSFKELFGFGGYMLAMNVVSSIGNEIQGLLIGRLYNPATMGFYSKARSTELLVSRTFNDVLSQITLPLYAELQDEKQRLITAIKKLTCNIAYLTFPLMFLMILEAKPLFVLLYSEKWLPSVPYFQILCLAGIAGCLQFANNQAIAAVGKSREMFYWTILKRIVGIAMIVGGLALFGMKGLLAGMVLQIWFMYLINVYLVSKHIGYGFWRQLRDLLPILLLSITSFIIAYFVGYMVHTNMYVQGGINIFIFGVVYLFGSIIFRFEELQTVKQLLGSVINNLNKKLHVKKKSY